MPIIRNHIFSTMWRSRWLVTILVTFIYQIVLTIAIGVGGGGGNGPVNTGDGTSGHPGHGGPHHPQQNYKISPKPCIVNDLEGTCMFVWECIKSEGHHVGMCVDSFMFGSCCSHNLTENVILPQTYSYSYSRPTPGSMGHHRPKPPPYKPHSGTTTIERPHGAGTLVIRPSSSQHHQHHNHHFHRPPYNQKPIIPIVSTTMKIPSPPSNLIQDLDTAASVSGSIWNTSPQTTQWHMTTEPNFITKPRPPVWEKPTSHRPKPQKPTKKPIERPTPSIAETEATRKPTTTKPKPQVFYPKPSKSTTTTTTTTTTSTTSRPIRPTTFEMYSTTTTSFIPSKTTSKTTPTTAVTKSPTISTISSTFITTTTTTTTPTPHKVSTILPGYSSAITSSISQQQQQQPTVTEETNEIGELTNTRRIATISAARGVDCGIPPMFSRPETRIVGGKNAPFGRWPWQVSVRRTSFFGFSSTHRCGGALINENWIATAGHCVDDLLTSQIRIRVGEYDFSHVQEQLPYIERGVAKKVVHPKYNFFTYEYDLALVKLEQPLEFAPHVSPICLPSTEDLLIGLNATVTGWGRLSEGGTLPSVLQEVSVPIVSNDNCKSMFLRAGRQEFIPDIFLCAGYESGGQDSCQGDSGGPLQVKADDGKYFLAGIISWGIGCAEANLPGVCTRISKFVPWIMENVT